jgi:hypothetical protein
MEVTWYGRTMEDIRDKEAVEDETQENVVWDCTDKEHILLYVKYRLLLQRIFSSFEVLETK